MTRSSGGASDIFDFKVLRAGWPLELLGLVETACSLQEVWLEGGGTRRDLSGLVAGDMTPPMEDRDRLVADPFGSVPKSRQISYESEKLPLSEPFCKEALSFSFGKMPSGL
jgi:hypothetical protein